MWSVIWNVPGQLKYIMSRQNIILRGLVKIEQRWQGLLSILYEIYFKRNIPLTVLAYMFSKDFCTLTTMNVHDNIANNSV